MIDIVNFWIANLPAMLAGLRVSLSVTGLTLLIGIPLGLFFALGVQSANAPLRWVSLTLVEIGRGAPALILLQFWYFGLPSTGISLSSFWAAVFSLAWTTSAYTSEIIRAGLQAVPAGQREAAAALGMTGLDTMRYAILPQGLRVAAPALLGFSISMLQATSLCFAIALPELLSQSYMIGSVTFQYMPILCFAGLIYAAICIPATIAVSALEKRLGRHAA